MAPHQLTDKQVSRSNWWKYWGARTHARTHPPAGAAANCARKLIRQCMYTYWGWEQGYVVVLEDNFGHFRYSPPYVRPICEIARCCVGVPINRNNKIRLTYLRTKRTSSKSDTIAHEASEQACLLQIHKFNTDRIDLWLICCTWAEKTPSRLDYLTKTNICWKCWASFEN